jgi:hypothetical protein
MPVAAPLEPVVHLIDDDAILFDVLASIGAGISRWLPASAPIVKTIYRS